MLTYIQIFQLIGFACLMSLGQILFKKTAISLSETLNAQEKAYGLIEGIIRALHIPWLYLALSVYAIATIFGYIFYKEFLCHWLIHFPH